MQEALTWKAPTLPVEKADTILAFAFGNRLAKNGNQLPGKMNQNLADLVVRLYQKTNKTVYAQWEIAQAIGQRIPKDKLIAIYPKLDHGKLIYLSTHGVAQEVTRKAHGAKNMGKTLIVAYAEHSLRAVETAKNLGIDAYAPAGVALPSDYDTKSGQPWTRDRLTFALYEIGTRAEIQSKALQQ
ncbi:hypothetical protein [Dongshaea marina]|uniref:hypothetical protein n=1 Tax=Dongshaea marina TaxID=2047966 RepID=UPI0018FF23D1|nr:hypothetical protein [Dongshaea marina]